MALNELFVNLFNICKDVPILGGHCLEFSLQDVGDVSLCFGPFLKDKLVGIALQVFG